MGGASSTDRRDEECVQFLVGKPEGKKLLGRSRRRCEDAITVDLREIRLESVDWMHFSQYRGQCRDLVKTVMNLRVIQGGEFLDFSFSRRTLMYGVYWLVS